MHAKQQQDTWTYKNTLQGYTTRIHYKDTLTPNAKEMKRDMVQYKT